MTMVRTRPFGRVQAVVAQIADGSDHDGLWRRALQPDAVVKSFTAMDASTQAPQIEYRNTRATPRAEGEPLEQERAVVHLSMKRRWRVLGHFTAYNEGIKVPIHELLTTQNFEGIRFVGLASILLGQQGLHVHSQCLWYLQKKFDWYWKCIETVEKIELRNDPRFRGGSGRLQGPSLMQAADAPEASPLPVALEKTENSLGSSTNEGSKLPAIDDAENVELLSKKADILGTVTGPMENKNEAHVTGKDNKPLKDLATSNQDGVADIKTKFTASKSSVVWQLYMKMVEEEDKDVLKDRAGAIDVTLVFTGLFSAISTGFLLESSKILQPDSAIETSAKPSKLSVWVNCLWLFSLSLSICVSLFAMLALGWCYNSRSKHSGTPYERAIRRQKTWDTSQKWKLELIIEQLHAVMHVALMVFFIGLVLFLSEIHRTAMVVTAIPVGLTIVTYGVLTIVPVLSPTFPLATPFTRILKAGRRYFTDQQSPRAWPYLPKLRGIWPWDREKWTRALHTACHGLIYLPTIFNPSRSGNQTHTTATRYPLALKEWVLSGCSKPVGTTSPYPRSEEQRYAFRALMLVLRHSNEKKYIDEVLNYIETFPEVVLDSFANSQELYNATVAVVGHLERLKHDPVECHDPSFINFQAKCSRLMYLNARPWLHPTSSNSTQTQGIYDFCIKHYPSVSPEELKAQIKEIAEQSFEATTCIPWLERQAIKIALGCPPQEGGFQLCKELYGWVSSKVPESYDRGGVYSTLSWISLNLAIDTNSIFTSFWPTPWPGPAPSEDDRDPMPTASPSSALTMIYFRHFDKRKADARWLNVVGLSGVLEIPTYFPSEDMEPNIPSNREFYRSHIDLLRAALTPASLQPSADEVDSYFGNLPVYLGSEVRLYNFDSLHYCFDVLGRALKYPQFADFHKKLNELKDLIPERRRGRTVPDPRSSKSDIDAAESVAHVLLGVHGADDA